MWKEDSEAQNKAPSTPEISAATIAVPPETPAAKRAVFVLVGFFLLQIVLGVIFGIVYSVVYIAGGGDPGDTDALTANIEGYTMQVNLLASYLASILLVLWLWRKVKNPADGFTYQFLGLNRCSLASLRRPAAVGASLGFGYIIAGGLLFPPPEGTEFGPMTTLSMSSGSDLVLWVITALFFAPIVEELLFRGVILKGFLQSWPRPPASYIAITVSVLGFTAFHYQEFVHFPFAAVAIMSMAAAATYFRLKAGNLFAASAVHFSYNLALVISLLLARLAV